MALKCSQKKPFNAKLLICRFADRIVNMSLKCYSYPNEFTKTLVKLMTSMSTSTGDHLWKGFSGPAELANATFQELDEYHHLGHVDAAFRMHNKDGKDSKHHDHVFFFLVQYRIIPLHILISTLKVIRILKSSQNVSRFYIFNQAASRNEHIPSLK